MRFNHIYTRCIYIYIYIYIYMMFRLGLGVGRFQSPQLMVPAELGSRPGGCQCQWRLRARFTGKAGAVNLKAGSHLGFVNVRLSTARAKHSQPGRPTTSHPLQSPPRGHKHGATHRTRPGGIGVPNPDSPAGARSPRRGRGGSASVARDELGRMPLRVPLNR